MSGITWLHLSDWHQRGKEFDRKIVRDALIKDISDRKNISPDLLHVDFIAMTGDITFSGKDDEYEAAVEFLFKPIFDALGFGDDGWKKLYVVPGNHDLDRTHLEKLQADLKVRLDSPQAISHCLETDWKRKGLLSPFSGYSKFVSKYLSGTLDGLERESAYSYISRLDKNGRNIAIIGFNSAWHSARNLDNKNEILDYGYLVMGEAQVYNTLSDAIKSDIKIALMHHPLNWLTDFDRDTTEEHLTRHCHFILHGHQHQPRVSVANSTLGDVIIIPGGACYDRRRSGDPRYTNAYNYVHLDFDSGQGIVYLRRWSDQQNAWTDDTETYKEGRFRFTAPKSEELLNPIKKEARQRLISRFIPTLRKRFCDDTFLGIRHTVEDHNGIKLVRQDVLQKIQISPGNKEEFKMETYNDDRVVRLVESGKIDLKPYESNYFKVNGQSIPPSKTGPYSVLYIVELDGSSVLIEYKYRLYLRVDDVYLYRLGRFTSKFKIRFQRDNQLAYNFKPIGGLPPTELKREEPFEYDEMEILELCFPDQGYLIQWYLADSEDITP